MSRTLHPIILVGVDGSAPSIEALKMARKLAPRLGASIEAIGCWHYPSLYAGYYDLGFEGIEEAAQKSLQEAVTAAYGSEVPKGFKSSLEQGDASTILIEHSKAPNAVMLVLGSRGHGGVAGLLLGSVSSACAAKAHCPVTVVHRPEGLDDYIDWGINSEDTLVVTTPESEAVPPQMAKVISN